MLTANCSGASPRKHDKNQIMRDILASKKSASSADSISQSTVSIVFNGLLDLNQAGGALNVELQLPSRVKTRSSLQIPMEVLGGPAKMQNGYSSTKQKPGETCADGSEHEIEPRSNNTPLKSEASNNHHNHHQEDSKMAAEVQAAPAMAIVVDNASESFVNKVSSLPVVASTWSQVYSAYNWSKEYNTMVKYTLEAAEKSVAVAASTAKPVVDRLEKPISLANDMACKQLDTLQEKLPIIAEPTEKVVSTLQDSTWHVIENTKKASSERVNNLMNTRMGKVVTSSVDMALTASDYAIEYYLPPDEQEKQDQEEEEDDDDDEDEIPPEKAGESVPADNIQKMGKVSNKLRRRLYNRALKNIQYAQKRSQETVEKLQFTVNLIDYAKSNIDGANQAIRTRVDTTQETLWTTWNDWTTEEGEDQGEDAGDESIEGKDGEQKTLAIARNLAGRLRILSRNVAASVRVLPENLRTRVEEARDLADSVYKSFEEAQYFSDLPSNMVTRAQEQLESLQETTKAVADYLINSRPLQWLVPNQVRHYLENPSSNGKEAITDEMEPNGSIASQDQ